MRLPVRAVIYFYIFICVVLLLFNLLYIFRSGIIKRQRQRKIQHWEKYLDNFAEGAPIWEPGELLRRLKNVQELMAFYEAMELREQVQPGAAASFFQEHHPVVLELAREYGEKDAMEQAFFAYVIAVFHPAIGDRRSPLLEFLLNYLDHSTVYSRENVLNALYALGNIQSVEHAFLFMSQRGWYHDPRLLADGLNRFRGEKEPLANRLWSCRGQLIECFQVGAIRFAEALDEDQFAEAFLRALETENLPTETQFTLVRYFRRHAVPYAQPALLRLLKSEAEGRRELAIAAATALASYPDEKTRQALKGALHSSYWYVRQNAARSLKAQGVTWEACGIDASTDRYATEMLEYILGGQPAAKGGEKEREVLAAV